MPIYDQQGNPVADPFEELDALFKKYGFVGRPGATQIAAPLQSAQGGDGVGDFAGLMADPRVVALTKQIGLNNVHLPSQLEIQQGMDPNGPGNGEGGSTLQNLGLGASFLLGGSGIAGMLGAPGLTAGQSLGQLAGFGPKFTPPSGLSGADDAFDLFQGQQMSANGFPTFPGSVLPPGEVGAESLNGSNYSGATSTTGPGVQTAGPNFSPLSPGGFPAATAGGAALAGAAQGGTAGALQRLMAQAGITGTAADLLSVGGAALPGLLGAFASSKQADTLKGIADEYKGFGAPSRARYESSFAPGFSMASDPGFTDALDQSAKATLHGLSVNGNPAGSPNAWAATLDDLYKKNAYPALQQYRGQNAATSGIANFNAAAPGAQTGQLQANANIFNGIGSAIGNVTNPAPTLADIMKQFGQLSGGNSIFRTA